jgi:RNA polymerase sigma factor (sigma-70 family)
MTVSPPGDPAPLPRAKMIEPSCGGMPGQADTISDVRARFIALYDREYPLVVRFLLRYGADLQSAEDATQEAFRSAWERYVLTDTWEHEIAQPRAWIRTVALNYYRRPPGPRRRPPIVLVPDFPDNLDDPDSSPELSAETLTVLEALNWLDPELRAVMAFHLDGFSAREIGVQLGLEDPQKVRDRLKKARKILATKLGPARNQGGRVL